MKIATLAILLAAALFALPALAADKPEPAVNADTNDAFQAVSAWVRKEMEPGGRYSYVSKSERSRVDQRLDEMGALLEKNGAVANMSDADKTVMFNSQEEVNAILAQHDNDRVVCKNVMPVGSHIPVKQCMTAGEMEARRRKDGDYLRRTQGSPQLKSGT